MPKVNLLNVSGETLEQIQLDATVFGIEPNKQVLFDVVNAQRAAMRQGTANTKGRSEVAGGGRKPWRQKGTGRARHGSIRSPLWRGGGVTFGPSTRSYAVKVNKKVRRLALKSAYSYLVANKTVIVIDELSFEQPKTKEFQAILNNLKIEGKVLFVVEELTKNEFLSARNIPTVSIGAASHVSVYDLLNTNTLVLTKGALKIVEEALSDE